MKSAWILFATTILHTFLRARGVRALFAPTCRYAAALLSRLALLALLALAFGANAPAQTAHFFVSESTLPTPTPLFYPAQVAVDTKGNIYIADQDNYRVVKETPSEGGFIETSISMGTGLAYGVAVDQSGDIFIACNNFSYLIKETPTPTGYTQSTFGSNLFASSSVAVDSQGRVYVAAYSELVVETPSGGGYVQSGIPLAAGHGVFSVAVDSNFNLYITGLDTNYLGHVWKLTPSVAGYTQVSLVTNPSGFGQLAVDGVGNIYVANGSYSDILVLAPSGGGYIGGALPQEQFYFGVRYMLGVAIDQNGNVFFTDYFNQLLGEYSPGGGNAGPAFANGGYSQFPVSEFFSIDTASTLGTEGVVSEGSNSAFPDFYDAGTGSCEGGFWSAGEVCSVDVYFQPTAAGDSYGAAVLYDGFGNTIATGYTRGIGQGPQVNFGPGTPIVENILSDGSAVAVDATGSLYTVAPGASTAFKDAPGGGPSSWIEVPIGSGLSAATGIAIDGGGNLYIADQANQQIVKETLSTNGYSKSVIANQANGLNEPTGVAVDASGNVYVSDLGTNAVLKETLLLGAYTQSVLPTSALNQPNGVTVDAAGNVYIADTNNNRVLKETLAGGGYTESTIGTGLSSPTAVAVDGFGNVYISETAAGEVFKETLSAGSYLQSTIESGIQPYGLAVDSNLDVYIAGSNAQLLVKLDVADAPTLSFASTGIGQVSSDSPKAITLSNAGNAPLILPVIGGQNNPYISTGYLLDQSAAVDCPVVAPSSVAPSTLAAGASCLLSISFSPLSAGPDIGNLTLFDNNLNAPAPNYTSQTIVLLGAGAVIQSQTINFAAIAPQTTGTMLNLSVTATSGLAVSFASLTPATCTVAGSTASLIAGATCTIQASQAGNNQYSAAPNVNRGFVVKLLTQTITFAAIAAQNIGATLNLAATASSGLPVSFSSTTPAICTVTGNSASMIAPGNCIIEASQPGNGQYAAAPNINRVFAVKLFPQTITFAAIAAQNKGTTLNLAATASSGLPVSFSSTTTAICTVSGSNASLVTPGICNIEASQGGNNDYAAAALVAQKFKVNP